MTSCCGRWPLGTGNTSVMAFLSGLLATCCPCLVSGSGLFGSSSSSSAKGSGKPNADRSGAGAGAGGAAAAAGAGAGAKSKGGGAGASADPSIARLVRFSEHKGKGVRASNFSVSGEGVCLANAALLQTKAFWELKIVEMPKNGTFVVGVAARDGGADMDKPLTERKNSWGLHSSKHSAFRVGDVIGVLYDLSDVRPVLSFHLNGDAAPLEAYTIGDVRSVSEVFPAVSVAGGCMLEANFGQSTPFAFAAPNNALPLMLSRDML